MTIQNKSTEKKVSPNQRPTLKLGFSARPILLDIGLRLAAASLYAAGVLPVLVYWPVQVGLISPVVIIWAANQATKIQAGLNIDPKKFFIRPAVGARSIFLLMCAILFGLLSIWVQLLILSPVGYVLMLLVGFVAIPLYYVFLFLISIAPPLENKRSKVGTRKSIAVERVPERTAGITPEPTANRLGVPISEAVIEKTFLTEPPEDIGGSEIATGQPEGALEIISAMVAEDMDAPPPPAAAETVTLPFEPPITIALSSRIVDTPDQPGDHHQELNGTGADEIEEQPLPANLESTGSAPVIRLPLSGKQRSALERVAKTDFERSRGHQHAVMLKNACKRLEKKTRTIEKGIKSLEAKRSSIRSGEAQLLRQALEREIVYNHLTEVPGIGPKFRQTIIDATFRGRLADLKMAGRVPGVGESRMRAIAQWVDRYQQRLPELLQQEFPGKREITLRIAQEVKQIDDEIAALNRQKAACESQVKRAQKELTWLEHITPNHFIGAMLNPEVSQQPDLDRFLQGVFPAWEPMPQWFKQLVSES